MPLCMQTAYVPGETSFLCVTDDGARRELIERRQLLGGIGRIASTSPAAQRRSGRVGDPLRPKCQSCFLVAGNQASVAVRCHAASCFSASSLATP